MTEWNPAAPPPPPWPSPASPDPAVAGHAVPPEESSASTEASVTERRKRKVELFGAIVIGFAAVLTAIAAYNSGEVDGTVEEKHTESVGLEVAANDAYLEATAEQAKERDWIIGYLTAEWNEEPAADLIFSAMPAEVAGLAGEWIVENQDLLGDPEAIIDDPFSEEYEAYGALRSAQLIEQGNEAATAADCAIFDARVAGTKGDGYGLATVFLAVALVAGGIAALLNRKAAQVIVLTTAVLSLVGGAAFLLVAGDPAEARALTAEEFFSEDDDGKPTTPEQALAIADDTCP